MKRSERLYRIWTVMLWSLLLIAGALSVHDAFADGPASGYPFVISSCDGDLAVTTSSATDNVPTVAGVHSLQLVISSTVNTYIAFGSNSVTAVSGSGHKLWAGVPETLTVPSGSTKIAFVGVSTGTVNVCWGVGL